MSIYVCGSRLYRGAPWLQCFFDLMRKISARKAELTRGSHVEVKGAHKVLEVQVSAVVVAVGTLGEVLSEPGLAGSATPSWPRSGQGRGRTGSGQVKARGQVRSGQSPECRGRWSPSIPAQCHSRLSDTARLWKGPVSTLPPQAYLPGTTCGRRLV